MHPVYFLPRRRCTIVQIAVLRLHVVCPSVCPSVTLVDQDDIHVGWKSCKLIARTISPIPSLFVAQSLSTYFKGNMGKLWGDQRGVGKSGVLEHKSGNISETRKGRWKVTVEGLYELTNALSNGTISDPLRPLLTQDWRFATPPKLQSLLSQEPVKLYKDFKFGRYIHRVHPNKRPLKFGERERGRNRTLPTFFKVPVPRIISGTGKATNLKFCLHRIDQKLIKNFRKSNRGRTQRLSKFFRAPVYRAHRAVIFAVAQLSCFIS